MTTVKFDVCYTWPEIYEAGQDWDDFWDNDWVDGASILYSDTFFENMVLTQTGYTKAQIKDIVNYLIDYVLMKKFRRFYCVSYDFWKLYNQGLCDKDGTLNEDMIDLEDFYFNVKQIVNDTLPIYLPLLKAYQSVTSENPIGKIQSENEVRFNDTPEEVGDFTASSYTSHITISRSGIDMGTLGQRLSDMYQNWASVIERWSNEFKGLFFEVR